MKNNSGLKILVLLFFVFNQFSQDVCALLEESHNSLSTNRLSSGIAPKRELSLPSELGNIQKSWSDLSRDSAPWVIHIQDLHVDVQAQKHISQILERIYGFLESNAPGEIEKGILIGMEGATGPIDSEFFSSFPERQIKEDAADYFLSKAKFTGPEFFSIIHPEWKPEIFGIEDEKIYLENKEAYQSCAAFQKQAKQWLKICETKNRDFLKNISSEKQSFLKKYRSYQKGNISFKSYLNFLFKMSHSVQISSFPNLTRFQKMMQLQKELKPEKIEKERNLLNEKLSQQLPREELQEWIRKGLEYRLGRIKDDVYFAEMKNLVGEETLKSYPDLSQYIDFVKLGAKLDHAKISNEIKQLELLVADQLFQSSEEKQFWKEVQTLCLVEKLISLKLSRKELKEFLEIKDEKILWLEKIAGPVSFDLSPFEKFYELAQKRDHILYENTLKRMKETNRSVVVLVTGGFHTDSFTQFFENENISYTVITPQTQGVDQKTEALYRARMLGKTSAFEQKLASTSHTLHQGSLLHALVGDADVARQLESTLRIEFEMTAGGEAIAGQISNIAEVLAKRHAALKKDFPDIADLRFFPREIVSGKARFVLVKKGKEAFVLSFVSKSSKALWLDQGIQVLADGAMGSYHLQMIPAEDFLRVASKAVFENGGGALGREAYQFLTSYIPEMTQRRDLVKNPIPEGRMNYAVDFVLNEWRDSEKFRELEKLKTSNEDLSSYFDVVDVLPKGLAQDLAYYDHEYGEIKIHRHLWNRIKNDQEALLILIRRKYIEYVLVPSLKRGLPANVGKSDFETLEEDQVREAHAIASRIDAQLEKTSYHALMKHTIPLLNNEELKAVKSRHPNDPAGAFQKAAKRELGEREKVIRRLEWKRIAAPTPPRDRDLILRALKDGFLETSLINIYGEEVDLDKQAPIQVIPVSLRKNAMKHVYQLILPLKGGGIKTIVFKVTQPRFYEGFDESAHHTQSSMIVEQTQMWSEKGCYPGFGGMWEGEIQEVRHTKKVWVFSEEYVEGKNGGNLIRALKKEFDEKRMSAEVYYKLRRDLFKALARFYIHVWKTSEKKMFIFDSFLGNLMVDWPKDQVVTQENIERLIADFPRGFYLIDADVVIPSDDIVKILLLIADEFFHRFSGENMDFLFEVFLEEFPDNPQLLEEIMGKLPRGYLFDGKMDPLELAERIKDFQMRKSEETQRWQEGLDLVVFKIPGQGETRIQGPPDPAKIDAMLTALRKEDIAEYACIPFEVVDSLEDEGSLVRLISVQDPSTHQFKPTLKIHRHLWNQIKEDSDAQLILRRHAWLQHVVIPRLFRLGALNSDDLTQAHTLASIVDERIGDGSIDQRKPNSVHALMKRVIQVMKKSELEAIQEKHPNDTRKEFYNAVQQELQRRNPQTIQDDKALFPWLKHLPGYSKWGPIFENLWAVGWSAAPFAIAMKLFEWGILDESRPWVAATKSFCIEAINHPSPMIRIVSAIALPFVFALSHLPGTAWNEKSKVFHDQLISGLFILSPLILSVFVLGFPALIMNQIIFGWVLALSFTLHFFWNEFLSLWNKVMNGESVERKVEHQSIEVPNLDNTQLEILAIFQKFHDKTNDFTEKQKFYYLIELLKAGDIEVENGPFLGVTPKPEASSPPIQLIKGKVVLDYAAFMPGDEGGSLDLEIFCISFSGFLEQQEKMRELIQQKKKLYPKEETAQTVYENFKADPWLQGLYFTWSQNNLTLRMQKDRACLEYFKNHGYAHDPNQSTSDVVRWNGGRPYDDVSLRFFALDRMLENPELSPVFQVVIRFELEKETSGLGSNSRSRIEKKLSVGKPFLLSLCLDAVDMDKVLKGEIGFAKNILRPDEARVVFEKFALFPWLRHLKNYEKWGPTFENVFVILLNFGLFAILTAVTGLPFITRSDLFYHFVFALGFPTLFSLFHFPKSGSGSKWELFVQYFWMGGALFSPLMIVVTFLGFSVAQIPLLIGVTGITILFHYVHNWQIDRDKTPKDKILRILRKYAQQMPKRQIPESPSFSEDFEILLEAIQNKNSSFHFEINETPEPEERDESFPIEVTGNVIRVHVAKFLRYSKERSASLKMFCIRAGKMIEQKKVREEFQALKNELFPRYTSSDEIDRKLVSDEAFRKKYFDAIYKYLHLEAEIVRREASYLFAPGDFWTESDLGQFHLSLQKFCEREGRFSERRERLWILDRALRNPDLSPFFQVMLRWEILSQKSLKVDDPGRIDAALKKKPPTLNFRELLTQSDIQTLFSPSCHFMAFWFDGIRGRQATASPRPGALKAPGSGETHAQGPPAAAKIDAILERLKRDGSHDYENLPFEIVESFDGKGDDFARLVEIASPAARNDKKTYKVQIRRSLWNRIQKNPVAQLIIKRHEYVENVLIPQLIREGVLATGDEAQKHFLTSAVDAAIGSGSLENPNPTTFHPLMKHVILLMRKSELQKIQETHPNDQDQAFYSAVQTELARRSQRQIIWSHGSSTVKEPDHHFLEAAFADNFIEETLMNTHGLELGEGPVEVIGFKVDQDGMKHVYQVKVILSTGKQHKIVIEVTQPNFFLAVVQQWGNFQIQMMNEMARMLYEKGLYPALGATWSPEKGTLGGGEVWVMSDDVVKGLRWSRIVQQVRNLEASRDLSSTEALMMRSILLRNIVRIYLRAWEATGRKSFIDDPHGGNVVVNFLGEHALDSHMEDEDGALHQITADKIRKILEMTSREISREVDVIEGKLIDVDLVSTYTQLVDILLILAGHLTAFQSRDQLRWVLYEIFQGVLTLYPEHGLEMLQAAYPLLDKAGRGDSYFYRMLDEQTPALVPPFKVVLKAFLVEKGVSPESLGQVVSPQAVVVSATSEELRGGRKALFLWLKHLPGYPKWGPAFENAFSILVSLPLILALNPVLGVAPLALFVPVFVTAIIFSVLHLPGSKDAKLEMLWLQFKNGLFIFSPLALLSFTSAINPGVLVGVFVLTLFLHYLWNFGISLEKEGAFAIPGQGKKISQPIGEDQVNEVLKRLDPNVYQGLKIERLERNKFPPEHNNDFAFCKFWDSGDIQAIYVREDLYDGIYALEKTDPARFQKIIEILRRHEYVENVLLRQLIDEDLEKPEGERTFQESDRDRRHAITSALDAHINGALHPLMKLVIPLMSDEELSQIQPHHPNDVERKFYLAVIEEQEKRLKERVLRFTRRVIVPQGDRLITLYVNKELLIGEKEAEEIHVDEIKNQNVRNMILKIAVCASTNVKTQKNTRSVEISLGDRSQYLPRFLYDDNPMKDVQAKGVVFDARKPLIAHAGSGVGESMGFDLGGNLMRIPYSDIPQGGAWLKGVLEEFLNTQMLYQMATLLSPRTSLSGVAQTKYPLVWGEYPGVELNGRKTAFIAFGLSDGMEVDKRFKHFDPHSLMAYGRVVRQFHDSGFIHRFLHYNNISILNGQLPVLHDLDSVIKREGLTAAQDLGYLYYELWFITMHLYQAYPAQGQSLAEQFLKGYFGSDEGISQVKAFLAIFEVIKRMGNITCTRQIRNPILDKLKEDVAGKFLEYPEESSLVRATKPSALKIPAKGRKDENWPPGETLQEKEIYLQKRVAVVLKVLKKTPKTEYANLAIEEGSESQFYPLGKIEPSKDHGGDLAYWDLLSRKIKTRKDLLKRMDQDDIGKEAKRILRRHEYTEAKIIADLIFNKGKFDGEDQIFTETDIQHAHAIACAVDAALEGTSAHALAQCEIACMSVEELENVEPIHFNDPKGLFYQAARKELDDRYEASGVEDSKFKDILISKMHFRQEKIGDRDTEVIQRALIKTMRFQGEKVQPMVIEALRSIYGISIAPEDIASIEIRLWGDEGSRKRVYEVVVQSGAQISQKNEYIFILKVFRSQTDVTPEARRRAREAGFALKAAGMHPSIGPHVDVQLNGGEKVTVYSEGKVKAVSLKRLCLDLATQKAQRVISEADYFKAMDKLYRSAVSGVLDMWKVLNGHIIDDPTPENIMMIKTAEGDYRVVFVDLDRVSEKPMALAQVLDILNFQYSRISNISVRCLGDGVMDAFGYDEARKLINKVLSEEIPQLKGQSNRVETLSDLEHVLNAYMEEGIDAYQPLPKEVASASQTELDVDENIDSVMLQRFQKIASILSIACHKILHGAKGERWITERDIHVTLPGEEGILTIDDIERFEQRDGFGLRKGTLRSGTYPYRKKIKNRWGVQRKEVREAYGDLFMKVSAIKSKRKGPVIVRVGGRPGSGKTAWVDAIAQWGLNDIKPSEIFIIHADDYSKRSSLEKEVEQAKKKGKKLVIVEGAYSLNGRDKFSDLTTEPMEADIHVFMEIHEDILVERLRPFMQQKNILQLARLSRKANNIQQLRKLTEESLSEDLASSVLKWILKSERARTPKNRKKYFKSAKKAFLESIRKVQMEEVRFVKDFPKTRNFIFRYTIDQERRDADIIIKNEYDKELEFQHVSIRDTLEVILNDLKGERIDNAIYALIDLLRNHSTHLFVLRIEDLIQKNILEMRRLSGFDPNELAKKIGAFLKEPLARSNLQNLLQEGLRLGQRQAAIATKHAPGEAHLTKLEAKELKGLAAKNPIRVMQRDEMNQKKIPEALRNSDIPPFYEGLHKKIARAILFGQNVKVPLKIGHKVFKEGRVEVCVINMGDDKGFRLKGRTRPIYEWTDIIEEKAEAVIRVYVTEAFVQSVSASILAQTLVHPLIERIGYLPHTDAVQHEPFYNRDAQSRENAKDGCGELSDLMVWILEQAALEEDWNYLRRMTESWKKDPLLQLDDEIEDRAGQIADKVKKKVWELLLSHPNLIESILKNEKEEEKVLKFYEKLLKQTKDVDKQKWLDALRQNPYFQPKWITKLIASLGQDPYIQTLKKFYVSILKDFQGKIVISLNSIGIKVHLPSDYLEKDYSHFLFLLEHFSLSFDSLRMARVHPQGSTEVLHDWAIKAFAFLTGKNPSSFEVVIDSESDPGIIVKEGKIYVGKMALTYSREQLFLELKNAFREVILRSEKANITVHDQDQVLETRLKELQGRGKDLFEVNGSVLDVLGGEARLRPWFESLGLDSWADLKEKLNSGKLHFMLNAELLGSRSYYVVQTRINVGDSITLEKGYVLFAYDKVDVFLTRAALAKSDDVREHYYRAAFTTLLQGIYGVSGFDARADHMRGLVFSRRDQVLDHNLLRDTLKKTSWSASISLHWDIRKDTIRVIQGSKEIATYDAKAFFKNSSNYEILKTRWTSYHIHNIFWNSNLGIERMINSWESLLGVTDPLLPGSWDHVLLKEPLQNKAYKIMQIGSSLSLGLSDESVLFDRIRREPARLSLRRFDVAA